MKILITGGTGFIGSHLAEYLCSKGHEVVVYDRYNPFNSIGWLENSVYRNKIDIRLGDIRDYDVTQKMCSDCNYIFHLAALIGIPYSFKAVKSYLDTNLLGTYNILEVAKNNRNIKKIILTSTSEVYGSAQKIPMYETHSLNPQSPYAASKIASDHLGMSYYYSYKLPITIIRPFNVYGPRQSERAVIPTIINQVLDENTKKIFLGNIKSKRDLTYVDDICNAFYLILKGKKNFGKVYNTGTVKNYTIKEICQKILQISKSKKKIIIKKNRIRPNSSEVDELKGGVKNFRKDYGWKPKVDIELGLQKTFNWYSKNLNNLSKKKDYVI